MPGAEHDDVWIVVPLYNEATVIAGVIEQVRTVFPNVVCVDDGSSDASARLAAEAGAVVVRHPVNLGQGAALQTGFDYARQDPRMRCVVTFDSDGQHRVEDALAAVERLEAGDVDVVLGSRFLDDRTNAGWLKRLVLRLAIAFTNVTTGMRLTDAHNGMRALSIGALERVQITQNRMAHASEIVSLIAKSKLRVAEIPVQIVYTEYSRAKGQSLWNSVNILIDLVLK